MQKETMLVFTGLSDKSDLFQKDFSIKFEKEENEAEDPMFVAIMRHKSLGLSSTIRERKEETLQYRSQQMLNQWIQAWNVENITANKLEPVRKMQERWDTLLSQSLDKDHTVDLEQFKNKEPFESSVKFAELKSRMDSLIMPSPPKMGFIPQKPAYKEPEVTFSQKLQFKKRKIIQAYEKEYDKKLEAWQKLTERTETAHTTRMADYEKLRTAISNEREALQEVIENERLNYDADRLQKNKATDILEINYQAKQSSAVEEYFHIVLEKSEYPDFFPKNLLLEYIPETQTLYVSAELTHPDLIPKQKIITLNKENNTEDLGEFSNEEFSQLYNDIIYKIILRSLYEIFSADKADTVGSIGYNGWVRVLNRGNGRYEKICITSIFTTRAAFEEINLHNIDPASCFQYLQGMSSTDLTALRQVETPMSIPLKNEAVVAVKKLLEPLDKGNNLANMNWLEFETKISALIKKEFCTETTETNLIHSSLELGMETITTDTDAYRGGKTIFYVKRSIKPISVFAVRELFGQIIHEGATRGILITTADFSPDAYEFAKNKPISLINGIRLLSLFEKHGQKLRINLREAISLETWLS
jgi:restriction system protein